MPPPAAEERQRTGAAAVASVAELSAWQRQASEGSQALTAFTAAHEASEQDEEHFAQSAALLGEGYKQLPIVCPPGTICAVDADLVHRAGRAALGARWRPMLKLSARRVSPPTGLASWNHDESVTEIPTVSTRLLPSQRDGRHGSEKSLAFAGRRRELCRRWRGGNLATAVVTPLWRRVTKLTR